jgi:RNase P/RNase MRP subunit p29
MQKRIREFRLFATTAILSASLAACGGYTTVPLGGTVFGLTIDGLVLANGNDTVAVPANATSYRFPNQIDDHGTYAITIASQPAGLTCAVSSPSGTATGVAITWANVICAVNTHGIGGTVTGLTTDGLQLTNGSDVVSVAANATSFGFAGRVAEGSVYGVAVLQQPTGQTCSVTKGTAVMGTTDVTDIQVTCQ